MQRTLYGERKGHYETRGLMNVFEHLKQQNAKKYE